jgi:large subunit ribosomal protein L35
MAYKFKPNKSAAKRFRVTRTGKLKRNHSFTSHLMSARPSSKRRKLRRPEILVEGHARNMRKLLGISGLHPNKVRHERELAEHVEDRKGDAKQNDGAQALQAVSVAAPAAAKTKSPAKKSVKGK